MKVQLNVVLVLINLILLLSVTVVAAQRPATQQGVQVLGTAFTYQGHLTDGNNPANGNYDFQFILYTVASGGSQVGPIVTKGDVAVSDGLFTTYLDFGPIFDGTTLYLEVRVRPGGSSGAYTPLAPRQMLTPTPYALHAQDSSTIEGLPASAFAAVEHTHDDRYYTKSASDSDYVNVTGDTMSGALAVPRVIYTTAHTQYFIVGSEAFVPGSNVPYVNTYGNGGAYISSPGGNALVAPVHLPQGAVMTAFKVFFNDTSSGDMTVYLARQFMTGGGYEFMAQVSSTGITGYDSVTTTSITHPTIDNTTTSYHVYAYSTAWDSNLRIKGALITYTISQAL